MVTKMCRGHQGIFLLDKWLDNQSLLCDLVSVVPVHIHDWKVVILWMRTFDGKWDVLKDLIRDKLVNKLLACPTIESSMGLDVVY